MKRGFKIASVVTIYSLQLILLSSCRKTDFNISNLNNNQIYILGHGGAGGKDGIPMNSYESFIQCFKNGAHGTELDVQLTKDSVLVAYHDHNLKDDTDAEGVINALNWQEVKEARYNTHLLKKFEVISLDYLFSNLPNKEKYYYSLDCKLYRESNTDVNKYYNTFSNALITLIENYNLKQNIFIESESEHFLLEIKRKQPYYKLLFYPTAGFESGYEIATRNSFYGMVVKTDETTLEQVNKAHSANLWVALWSVNQKQDNVKALEKNPDIIQTDKVKHLVKLIDQ